MRINLRVPFEQKDAAKELGARWDAAKKIWYVIDPEILEVFADWMPTESPSSNKTIGQPLAPKSAVGVVTGPARFQPMCQCVVLPWEHCEHSAA
jgi:hypothetical protein